MRSTKIVAAMLAVVGLACGAQNEVTMGGSPTGPSGPTGPVGPLEGQGGGPSSEQLGQGGSGAGGPSYEQLGQGGGTTVAPPGASVLTSPCLQGTVATYRFRADSLAQGRQATPVRLQEGFGGAPMSVACESVACSASGAAVISKQWGYQFNPDGGSGLIEDSAPHEVTYCVSNPPACPSGQFPAYITPSLVAAQGQWTCAGTCDALVQEGNLFNARLVCSPQPPACSGDAPALFDPTTEGWKCDSQCTSRGAYSGEFDPFVEGGALVCVPC